MAVDDGEISYGCAVNPSSIRSASLVLWVGVHSSSLGLRTLFDQARVTDGWQYRSDGRWQLWGQRPHVLPRSHNIQTAIGVAPDELWGPFSAAAWTTAVANNYR